MRLSPILLAASGLLAACAGPSPLVVGSESLLANRLFAAPTEPIRTDDVFALSPAMRRYLSVDVADQIRTEGPQAGLMDALRQHTQLKLEYDAARTKNAAATFESRTGNCLSLVIMTAALAKELLRVINISKLESAYRLRLAPDGTDLQWLTLEDDKEVVLGVEPESSFWLRVHNMLLGWFVPEKLL